MYWRWVGSVVVAAPVAEDGEDDQAPDEAADEERRDHRALPEPEDVAALLASRRCSTAEAAPARPHAARTRSGDGACERTLIAAVDTAAALLAGCAVPSDRWLVLAQTSTETRAFSVPVARGRGGRRRRLARRRRWCVAAARRVPDVDAGPATQELPPVARGRRPAVRRLRVGSRSRPGDGARPRRPARWSRSRRSAGQDDLPAAASRARRALTAYEQRVLDDRRRKAIDGVVPDRGADDRDRGRVARAGSAGFQQGGHREVAGARPHPRPLAQGPASGFVGFGPLAVGRARRARGHRSAATQRRRGGAAPASPAASPVVILSLAISVITGELGRSLAQLPTDDGKAAAAPCLGLQRHLRENEHFDELPPAAVRSGAATSPTRPRWARAVAVALLPMGAEDDHRAWSRFGGRWRRVRVRYPRRCPPAWGKHPAFALFLAVLWGTAAVAALYGSDERVATTPIRAPDPDVQPRPARLDRAGRAPALHPVRAAAPVGAVRARAGRARPVARRATITGELVRAAPAPAVFKSRNEDNPPKYWYYLAVDDGTRHEAARVPGAAGALRPRRQGETVTAVYTPNLGYVRELRRGGPAERRLDDLELGAVDLLRRELDVDPLGDRGRTPATPRRRGR